MLPFDGWVAQQFAIHMRRFNQLRDRPQPEVACARIFLRGDVVGHTGIGPLAASGQQVVEGDLGGISVFTDLFHRDIGLPSLLHFRRRKQAERQQCFLAIRVGSAESEVQLELKPPVIRKRAAHHDFSFGVGIHARFVKLQHHRIHHHQREEPADKPMLLAPSNHVYSFVVRWGAP